MKKNVFSATMLILCALCANALLQTHVMAQPILTSANSVPAIGTTFVLRDADSAAILRLTLPQAGASQAWNFSSWTTQVRPAYNLRILAPSATPHTVFSSTATSALFNERDSSYVFYQAADNRLSILGTANRIQAATVYSPNQIFFTFPFSISSAPTVGTHSFTRTIGGGRPGGMGAGMSITTTVMEFDTISAWASGRLLLPNNVIIENALCVRRAATSMDSIPGIRTIVTNTVRFEFYDGINRYPVLTITPVPALPQGALGGGMGGIMATTGNMRLATTATLLQNLTSTGIRGQEMFSTMELVASPNPTQDNVALTYTLSQAANVHIEVLDMLGRVMFTTPATFQAAGAKNLAVNTQQLSSGRYLVFLVMRSADGSLERAVVRLSVVR